METIIYVFKTGAIVAGAILALYALATIGNTANSLQKLIALQVAASQRTAWALEEIYHEVTLQQRRMNWQNKTTNEANYPPRPIPPQNDGRTQ